MQNMPMTPLPVSHSNSSVLRCLFVSMYTRQLHAYSSRRLLYKCFCFCTYFVCVVNQQLTTPWRPALSSQTSLVLQSSEAPVSTSRKKMLTIFCFLHHGVILYYTPFGVDAFVELYAEIKAKSETNTAR